MPTRGTARLRAAAACATAATTCLRNSLSPASAVACSAVLVTPSFSSAALLRWNITPHPFPRISLYVSALPPDAASQTAVSGAPTRAPPQRDVRTLGCRSFESAALLEHASRAERDAFERRIRDPHLDCALCFQSAVDAGKQGAAAGEQDAVAADVGRQLRRSRLERPFHGVDDPADAVVDRRAHLRRRDRRASQEAGDPVAAGNLRCGPLG